MMKKRQEEILKQLSDKELIIHLYATQIVLLTISIILGMIVLNDISEFFSLFNFWDREILIIGGLMGFMVVLLDLFLMSYLPPRYYDDGGVNNRIFQNRSVGHIAIITLLIAFSEEILFRGMIQTQAGLWIASFIFALVHYRYLFNWFLFVNITVLSFLIGIIFEITENIVVTIFMHFIIDFSLGIFIKFRKVKE